MYGRVIAGRGRAGDRGGNGRRWRARWVVGVLGSSYSAQLHARRPLVRFYRPRGYTAGRRRVNQGLQWPWPATHCLDAPECRPDQKISFRRFSRAMGGSAAPRTRPLPTCGARGVWVSYLSRLQWRRHVIARPRHKRLWHAMCMRRSCLGYMDAMCEYGFPPPLPTSMPEPLEVRTWQ